MISVKRGIKISDADESEMCKRNEWCGASKMDVKRVHESPE